MIVVVIYEYIVDYDNLEKIMILWLNMIQRWLMMGKIVIVLIIYLEKVQHNINCIVKLQLDISMIFLWVKTRLFLHMGKLGLEKRILCLVQWMILKIMVLFLEHCTYLFYYSQ
jgi:hypothetical protein